MRNMVKSNTNSPYMLVLLVFSIIGSAFGLMYLFRTVYVFALADNSSDELWNMIRNAVFVAGVSVGAPFLVWRTFISDRLAIIQQQKQDTEFFFAAVSKLDDNNLSIRVGTIYSLSNLAETSGVFFWPIIETLSTYIKINSSCADVLSDEKIKKITECRKQDKVDDFLALYERNEKIIRNNTSNIDTPPCDIQAALSVLAGREGRLVKPNHQYFRRIDLTGACMQGADLRTANLTGMRLMFARMEGADLRGANLEDANLFQAHLEGSYLDRVRLRGANIAGAVFSGCNYVGDKEQLARDINEAFGDEWTILPTGIEKPAHWPTGLTGWQEVFLRWEKWRLSRGMCVYETR